MLLYFHPFIRNVLGSNLLTYILVFYFILSNLLFFHLNFCYRQTLLSQRSGDGDKLNPSHVTSSRGPLSLDLRGSTTLDDDDKLLDVVGPPQSPLLSLGHQLHHLHPQTNSGKSDT